MNALCLILTRAGSKGVPGKNTRFLVNKPMVAWSIEAAQRATLVERIVISTDDPEMHDIAKQYGVEFHVERDIPDRRSRMVSLLEILDTVDPDERFDTILDLHADCPFHTAEDIDTCLNKLTGDTESVVSVTEMGANHPARAKKIAGGYLRDYCMEEPKDGLRQNLPTAYIRAGGIYVYTRKALVQDGHFGHTRTLPYVLPPERAVNVDSELDWLVAQAIAERVMA